MKREELPICKDCKLRKKCLNLKFLQTEKDLPSEWKKVFGIWQCTRFERKPKKKKK